MHLQQRHLKAAAFITERLTFFALLLGPAMGMFFAPESYFSPQDFSLTAPPQSVTVPYGRYFTVLMILWLSKWALLDHARAIRSAFRLWPILLFICWMLISTIYAPDPAGAFNRAVRTLCLVLFAGVIVEQYSTREVLRYLVIAGLILLAVSALAVAIIPEYALSSLTDYEGAWRGATVHKNTLGASAALLIIQLIYCYRLRVVSLVQFLIFSAFSGLVLFKAESGTAVLMASLGIVFGLSFLSIRKLKGALPRIIVSIACISCSFVWLLMPSTSGAMFALVGRDATLTGRTDIWNLIWKLIEHRPLQGYGSNFWAADSALRTEIWTKLGWAAPHAHNTLLDITFQTGFIGLVLFLLSLIIFLLRTAVLMVSDFGDDETVWVAIILMLILRGLTETQFVEPGSTSWFLFALGLGLLSKFSHPIVRSMPLLTYGGKLKRVR